MENSKKMIHIIPQNHYILLGLIEDKRNITLNLSNIPVSGEEKISLKISNILIPEEKNKVEKYKCYKAIRVAPDCVAKNILDRDLLVDNTMVEEIKIENEILYFIKENYIIGILTYL